MFDFLRKAAQNVGNFIYNSTPVGGAIRAVNRAQRDPRLQQQVQQAQRAVQQVQRQIPQPPPVPKINLPKIDLGTATRLLSSFNQPGFRGIKGFSRPQGVSIKPRSFEPGVIDANTGKPPVPTGGVATGAGKLAAPPARAVGRSVRPPDKNPVDSFINGVGIGFQRGLNQVSRPIAGLSKNVAEPFNASLLGGLGRETVNLTKLAPYTLGIPGIVFRDKLSPTQQQIDLINRRFFPEPGTKNSLNPTKVEDYNTTQKIARLAGSASKTGVELAALSKIGGAIQGAAAGTKLVQGLAQGNKIAQVGSKVLPWAARGFAEGSAGRFLGGLAGNSMFTTKPESVNEAFVPALKFGVAQGATNAVTGGIPVVGKIPILKNLPKRIGGAIVGAATAPWAGVDPVTGAAFGGFGVSSPNNPVRQVATKTVAQLGKAGGSIKNALDRNAPITVKTLAEKGKLLNDGYTNVKVKFDAPTHAVDVKNNGIIRELAPKGIKGVKIDKATQEAVDAGALSPQLAQQGYKVDADFNVIDPKGKVLSIGEVQQLEQASALTKAEKSIARGTESYGEAEGLTKKLGRQTYAETAPQPRTPNGRYDRRAFNPEVEQLKQYQLDQMQVYNTTKNPSVRAGAAKNFEAAQRRIDALEKPVGQPIYETVPKGAGAAKDPLEALKQEARKYKSAEEFDKFLLSKKQVGDPVVTKELDNLTKEAQKLIDSGMDSRKATNQVLRSYQDRLMFSPEKYKSLDEFLQAQGKPLYHGTNAKFDKFSLNDFGRSDQGFLGKGIYLTGRKGNAKIYGKNIVDSYANLKNPLEYNDSYTFGSFDPNKIRAKLGLSKDASAVDITNALKAKGYDGVIVHNVSNKTKGKMEEVLVLDPSQIKTKQQLTDLYNQAHKPSVKSKPIYETVPKGTFDKPKKLGRITPSDQATKGQLRVRSEVTPNQASLVDQQPLPIQGLPGQRRSLIEQTQSSLDGTLKQSGFAKNLKAKGYKEAVYSDIPGFRTQPTQPLLDDAAKRVKQNERSVISSILNRDRSKPVTDQQQADAIYLLNKLGREGRDKEMGDIAKVVAINSREAGRVVQMVSRLQALTPEGATVRAERIIAEYNDKFAKANKHLTLSDANKSKIIELASDVQKYADGTREHDVAAAKLMKYIEELVPPSVLKKISSAQTMAQLLNPKTAIRNIVGNLGMAGFEDISTVPAALLDRVVSKLAGTQRTTAIASPIAKGKGLIKGLKYGVQDARAGIKTSGLSGKFEIQPDVFKKGIMKKLQTALGYELGAADKAFYTAQFDSTLNSMMRAQKLKVPTKDMMEIANQEALYSTFQNNSAIAQGLQKAKQSLNVGKDWGVGDLVLKYPKTPGNIVSTGIDYSPVGAAKGLYQLARNWGALSPSVQREAVRNIGRGLTGTGLITMGYVLASNGIITGKRVSDKDMAALDRQQGEGPFSFNFTALQRFLQGKDTKPQEGDVIANYDWLQPNAIQLSMGANMVVNAGKPVENWLSDASQSLGDAVNTIVEQPVLKGVGDFISIAAQPDRGGGLGKAFMNIGTSAPASFVPSIVNQIGQLTDNTARSRYAPDALGMAYNSFAARVPGLRNTLQPQVDTFGNIREQYADGSNNLFNVFVNPAFVRTFKTNPAYELVGGIFDRSGETQQAPRLAQYKVTINGQSKQLTPEEYKNYQQYIGTRTAQAYDRLARDSRFLALNDTDKATYMNRILTDINTAAKVELFGNEPTNLSRRAQDVLNGQTLGYETPRLKSKRTTTKRFKKKVARKGRTRRGRGVRIAKSSMPKLRSIKLSAGKVAKPSRTAKVKFRRYT